MPFWPLGTSPEIQQIYFFTIFPYTLKFDYYKYFIIIFVIVIVNILLDTNAPTYISSTHN